LPREHYQFDYLQSEKENKTNIDLELIAAE
jgi:hypothetical protein